MTPRQLLPSLGIAAAALWAGVAGARPYEPEPTREFWDPLVVTPAGQASRVSESPSTTFVITADEIRRSGATSIPEILRRVPGLDVRLITATDGELGLRGFAYEITDRVLVMVDGRTVYIDFFGGTAYEMLPISLVDIERIEVVLGPGASVYGNKAMLGTINIVTRSAADYPVAEARVDAGPPGDGRVGVRYGARDGPWRVRATGIGRRLTPYEPEGRSPAAAGGGTLSASYSPSTGAEASLEIGGVRGFMDMIPTNQKIDRFEGTVWYLRARGKLGLGGPSSPYGDLHLDLVWNAGEIRSETFPPPSALEPGGFRGTYHTPYARLHHELRTRIFDVPVQGRWGGEVRLNTLDSTITTGERPVWNVAAFGSEEVLLGRWRLTAGLRVDRSTLTRVSFSPRLSAVWSPVEGHQIRAAFNTGYNDPHLLEHFANLSAGAMSVRPNLDLAAEHVVYGELGWNGGLTPWLRAFASAFAYRFDDWISLDPTSIVPTPTGFSVAYGNNDKPVDTYGGEVGLELSPRRTFSAYATYALIEPQGHTDVGPYGTQPHFSPRHKVGAGVRIGLPPGAYLTADAQYFGRSEVARPDPRVCPTELFCREELGDFLMAQARVGYAFRSGLDASLAVSNALDDRTRQLPGAEAPERRAMATVAYYH